MSAKNYLKANPSLLEKKILDFWQRENIFAKSLLNKDQKFVFYDGPPFANGLPHYGHLLTGFVKDAVGRYQAMRGKCVQRRFGWDCHGLPAEMGAEKELGISGRTQIEKFGIKEFNEHCKTSVMRYAAEWRKYVDRQARWVDFDNDYRTMNKDFMESVIWAFKQLHLQGLIYEDYRVMPYSWACETPLSNFEVRLDNAYRQKTSKAVTVAFKLEQVPDWILESYPFIEQCKILAWTTTPWTLPSNLALAVGPEMQYTYAISGHTCYVMSKACLDKYLPETIGKTPRMDDGKFTFVQLKESHLQQFIELHDQLDNAGGDKSAEYKRLFNQLLEHEHWAILNEENAELAGYIVCKTDNELDESVQSAQDFSYILSKKSQPYAREIFISWLEWAFLNLKIDQLTCVSDTSDELEHLHGSDPAQGGKSRHHKAKLYQARGFAGHKLSGYKYHPLFPYFSATKNAFAVLEADFVADEEGTGIVHSAPGFGEEDFMLCKKYKIPVVCPVDNAGKFTSEVADFQNMHVFDANEPIITRLKQQNAWIKTEQHIHNYPHCWRTDTPLIYKAISSWYVKVTAIKERMVTLNQQVNWIPSHIKQGLFGKWLEGAKDWSISRNRFWGTPIPIWKSDDPKYPRIDVYGSVAELEKDFKVKVEDLHRPFIDSLVRPNPNDPTGKSMMRRVPEVLDCWFESGSMPHAEVHYPFNQDSHEGEFKPLKAFKPLLYPPKRLPADFIVEYVAQTRGWFYTLFVLSVALFDRIPFKNCICHGVILDESGHKLSKRLNNYIDPLEVMEKHGADALRFLMLSSPVMQGGDLLIDKECTMVKDILRLVINPIWNAYNFFASYADVHQIRAALCSIDVLDEQDSSYMDHYILLQCRQMILAIDNSFKNYKIQNGCKAFREFIDILNNWYIRRNRDRFTAGKETAAYNILYTVLHYTSLAVSPLLPIISECIYQGLSCSDEASVHLQSFPANEKFFDHLESVDIRGFSGAELLLAMDKVRSICNAALAIRNNAQIRIRQPLKKLVIICKEYSQDNNSFLRIMQDNELLDAIKGEVNVKAVEVVLEDWHHYAHLVPKINFPLLAKRLPHKVKEINMQIKQNNWQTKDGLVVLCNETLTKQECELTLEPKDKKNCFALSDSVILLDLNIDENLRLEGITRDLIRFIQETRKQAGFQINNKINLVIVSDFSLLLSAVEKWSDDIKKFALVENIDVNIEYKDCFVYEYEIERHKVKIGVKKA